MSTKKERYLFQTRINAEIGALVEQRGRLQKICDELDELLDKKGDAKTRVLLNGVQGCINLIRDAERELYFD